VVDRWAGTGRREGYPDLARKVIGSKPHVIFAQTGRLAQAFRTVTSTIPIVTMTTEPVELGLANSLARPGGNVTGLSLNVGIELLGKRLELLKEVVPTASRFVYLAPRAVWEGIWGGSCGNQAPDWASLYSVRRSAAQSLNQSTDALSRQWCARTLS